jgi:anti-sigma B factor antagonist
MHMQIQERDGIHVIELASRIDVSSSPELEKLCNSLIDDGKDKIVCDFSSTEYVSSMGLRVFLSTLKRTRKASGNVVLCCLKPGIVEIFDMTGLISLFPVFDSTEEALAFFHAEPSQPAEAKAEIKHGAIEEIIIEKQPQEVTLAYLIAQKQGRMDAKV